MVLRDQYHRGFGQYRLGMKVASIAMTFALWPSIPWTLFHVVGAVGGIERFYCLKSEVRSKEAAH